METDARTERIVEDCADLLLSDSLEALIGAAEVFEELSQDSYESRWSEDRFSRLLQELLAYKRGAVVDHLLHQIVEEPADPNANEHVGLQRLYLCRMMVALSENEAVAKYCMKEKQKTRALAKALLDAQAHLLHNIPDQLRGKDCAPDQLLGIKNKGGEKYVYLKLAVENVKGFANFCYASKTFRLALQASEDFFPGLESLLARDITKHASAQLLEMIVKSFSNLMRGFCLFEDSQEWALDKGVIRIHADLTRLSAMDGVTESLVGDLQAVAKVVNGPGPTSRDLRKRLAASGNELRHFDRRIRDRRDPRGARKLREQWLEMAKAEVPPGVMPLLMGSSLGERISSPPGLVHNALEDAAKTFQDRKGGFGSAPIVCSWARCDIGSVVDAGRPFSKCANCSLAFYCSKEHQKLHWAIHKKQCRAEILTSQLAT